MKAAHPDLDVPQRILSVLAQECEVDIAVAPEFSVTADHVRTLKDELSQAERALAGLIVAGSGKSNETNSESRPWNEAHVLSSTGRTLWTQRKLWTAAVREQRAKQWQLPTNGSRMIHEDTASGEAVMVGDVAHFGRIVVLICQDLVNKPLSTELVRQYQPDWIFCPILDGGIERGRWAHSAAFDMSKEARTRYLIACSTALIDVPSPDIYFGLAVGPLDADADDAGRMAAGVMATDALPKRGTIQWRSDAGDWKKTTLS